MSGDNFTRMKMQIHTELKVYPHYGYQTADITKTPRCRSQRYILLQQIDGLKITNCAKFEKKTMLFDESIANVEALSSLRVSNHRYHKAPQKTVLNGIDSSIRQRDSKSLMIPDVKPDLVAESTANIRYTAHCKLKRSPLMMLKLYPHYGCQTAGTLHH